MHRTLLTTTILGCCALAATAAEDIACPAFAKAPVIDGQLADWAGRPALTMTEPNVDDLKVEDAQLGWDATNLYVAAKVKDKALVNAKAPGAELGGGDVFELRLVSQSGEILRLFIAPTTSAGKPAIWLGRAPGFKQPSTAVAAGTDFVDPSGVKWAVVNEAGSWTVEASIPKAAVGLDLKTGAAFPFVVVVWDRDATDIDEWKQWHKRSESSNQKKPSDEWPRLKLAD
jgi:hypothetical protein